MKPLQISSQDLEFENLVKLGVLPKADYNFVKQDSIGNIWLGTWGYGLLKFDGHELIHFKVDLSSKNSIGSNNILMLELDDRQNILLGTTRGICKIDQNNNLIDHEKYYSLNNFHKDINYFHAYYNDPLSGEYYGTNLGLIFDSITSDSLAFFEIPMFFKSSTPTQKYIFTIIQDVKDSDILWIGTNYGLRKFSKSQKKFDVIKGPKKWHGLYPKIQEFSYYNITQGENRSLYLGGCNSGGILIYDPQINTWSQHLYQDDALNPYEGNKLNYISFLDSENLVYSCNAGAGLFNLKSKTYSAFNIDDSNPKDGNYTEVLIDNFGCLWHTSSEGVFRSTSQFLAKEKTLFTPTVYKVIINDTPIQNLDAIQLDLPLDSNNIEIHFDKINIPEFYNKRFTWQLEGYDKTWKNDTEYGIANYTNLPKGSYLFRYALKTIKKNHEFIEGHPFKIKIIPPFYKTTFFILSILSLIGLLTFLGFKLYVIKVRKQERLKSQLDKEMSEIKMSALRAQMNPHFLFNTMNSINHYILINDSEKASYYLTKFSRLIRQVLNNSKESSVLLVDELEVMKIYIEMEQLRFNNKFSYSINLDKDVDENNIKLPPLLLQPYIENAIWHGLMHLEKTGKLTISIACENKELQISIKDNGIGRKASLTNKSKFSNRKSHGMTITKDRLNLVNLLYEKKTDVEIIDIVDKDGNALGTEIVLNIPILEY